ncbi:hypothetical protein RMSM_01439 [Rhodopirellula maiorica SM1]|uniref:Uncharacterized protein n=1 Tax=Rhodopirellula maiorica SM1 TaxID=1265738 RepID=M5RQR7_9BACT|nr:hypothetical protein [Rhodopirellula maiorica]EMI21640.1 hypothetical protein RMSM_01439 [Rhodopirellula maiorica SM1]
MDNDDSPDMDGMAKLATSTELVDTVSYLHTPDGVGRSKVASAAC